MEEIRTHHLRRPETLRWLVVIAVAVVLALTIAMGARAAATDPLVTLVNFPAALILAWFGWSMARAPASKITFDGERIFDDAGVELCTLDEMVNVERGFAMFKPSGGFAILLNTTKSRDWSPGLWWRWGKRIGIGGATLGRSGRSLADALTVAIAMKQLEKEGLADPKAAKAAKRKSSRKGKSGAGR